MPYYEYKCLTCEIEVLEFRAIANRDDTLFCSECPDSQLERILSLLSRDASAKINSTAKTRVKDFIEASKDELKGEKKALKQREK